MSDTLKHCLELLKDNDEEVYQEARRILLKLCRNISTYPKDLKFRKIKLANTIVSTALLPASGAIESLFAIGFIEDDDGFFLPLHAVLDKLKEFITLLENMQKHLQVNVQSVPSNSSIQEKQFFSLDNEIPYKAKGFFKEIYDHFQHVLIYEDKALQEKAKALIPLPKLEVASIEKLRALQKDEKINGNKNIVVYEDLLLAELLNWFKLRFFEWVDAPACKNCKCVCTYDRTVSSRKAHCSRIEIFKCFKCNINIEFPRYTNPEVLLKTRRGRCGEWANAFTLLCRSLGFDARLVWDETDHIWTEVWSVAHNRWIHADPSENAMDEPLMYEKGWGKKLTYIIAYSKDEVQDVTWRYTRDAKSVLKRRRICSEETLVKFIDKLNSGRQNSNGYSNYRKHFVIKRKALELAEMLTAPPGHIKPNDKLDKNEYCGRSSGSLSWRISRGETNLGSEPSNWIIKKGVEMYQLSYYIVDDIYKIEDIKSGEIIEIRKKWYSGIELVKGKIFRKEELDWKMVYLARSPESALCQLKWNFILENPRLTFKMIKFYALTATFNNAVIKWEIIGTSDNDENKLLYIPKSDNFETEDLKGFKKFSILATLSGGEGQTAWQHAQLFRESLEKSSDQPCMKVIVYLDTNPNDELCG